MELLFRSEDREGSTPYITNKNFLKGYSVIWGRTQYLDINEERIAYFIKTTQRANRDIAKEVIIAGRVTRSELIEDRISVEPIKETELGKKAEKELERSYSRMNIRHM